LPGSQAEIKFSPDYRKVPIARLGEEVVNDSSAIVNRVAELLRARGAGGGKKELDRFFSDDAQKWATWADTKLAVLLFPNITRSFGESYQAFSYVQVGLPQRMTPNRRQRPP
jgi:microsomal prostaglandin-E synthase 2